MNHLIPVSKDGEYIEVHPSTLAQHKALGWVECERQQIDPREGKLSEAELRAILIAELQSKGVAFDDSLPTDDLRALSITDPDTNKDGKLSISEIRDALTAKGVKFDPKAKKADLLALLEG